MGSLQGIPKGAVIAINDMLDNCALLKPGQEVVILADIDGLYGGDNLVDQEAVSWIQQAVTYRGANASVLWINEVAKPHAWRFPPVVKAAAGASDLIINNSFDIVHEELTDLKHFFREPGMKTTYLRNFAVTAPLLCTPWAQTPYELVSEIRYQAGLSITVGAHWQLTDPNGTHLEGIINQTTNPRDWRDPNAKPYSYAVPRDENKAFPEWLTRPIKVSSVNGVFIFDCMLSWWSRYIGISPIFNKSIRLTIENSRITKIEGGDEADRLTLFLAAMKEHLGDGVYDIRALHSGVHPQAMVGPQQCPHTLYRRLIEHSHSSNIHIHIGAPSATESYPYWMHCTGDIRNATFKIGNNLIHDCGHLTALDHPAVKAVAAKYPGRPGLDPAPRSY